MARESIFQTFIVGKHANYISQEVDPEYKRIISQAGDLELYPKNILEQIEKNIYENQIGEITACKFYLKTNPATDCLRLYTSDSPFASNMNKSLALRNYAPYQPFIATLLYHEKHLDPRLMKDSSTSNLIVYTGIALPEEILESIYIVDEIYYWTTFITTTSQKEEAIRFLLQGVEEGIGVLFQITLSINSYNKYNLSKYSSLIESSSILLLPFFKFRVMERKLITDPHTDKKTAFIILEEQTGGNSREIIYGNMRS